MTTGELEPLRLVDRHDAHPVAPLLENRGLARLTFGRLVAQMLDKPSERQAPAPIVSTGHVGDLQDVGEHLLAPRAHHQPGVRARLRQQPANGLGQRDDVALSMKTTEQVERVNNRRKPALVTLASARDVVWHPKRMQPAHVMAICEQCLVVDREQRASERREQRELIVGPFDGGERRANGRHFLALVKGSSPDEQMANPACLQRVDVRSRDIGAKGVESTKQQADVPRLDRHASDLAAIVCPAFRDRPSALTNEPLDERADRIGKRAINGGAGNTPVTIRPGNGKSDNRRLRLVLGAIRREGHVARVRTVRLRRRRRHERREGAIDEVLNGRHRPEAGGERHGRNTGTAELVSDPAVHANVGAAKAIDRLLRIANQEDLAWRGHNLVPVVLGGIGRCQEQQDLCLPADRCPGTRRRRCECSGPGRRVAPPRDHGSARALSIRGRRSRDSPPPL